MTDNDSGPSDFTRMLLDELARSHYSIEGWRKFTSDSWARSLEDVSANPALTRSFLLSAGAIFLAGGGIVALSWSYQSYAVAVRSIALWLPWYVASMVFVLTHLGMADRSDGAPNNRFSAPSQLTFIRLGLAPLILMPCLGIPVMPKTETIFALFIAFLAASDALDGWLARRQGTGTRLGRMLDYLADLAFLTFLSLGLYYAAAIPASLLWLLIVRYPFSVIVVLVLYLARGPMPLHPTLLGKITTLATSVVLLLIACSLLLGVDWPPSEWVHWLIWMLQVMIGVNIVYLVFRGITWGNE